MSATLLIDRRGPVDWVTLNRPHRLNSLDEELTTELRGYFNGLCGDRDCRVVVMRGAGRGFCSGADLASDWVREAIEDGVAASMRVQTGIRDVMLAMRRCPQPIVTLLHGPAYGGGFAMALASDIRIATPGARLSAGFIRIGVGGADMGVSYLLPRLIGASASHALLLTGREIDAGEAFRLGLVAEVVVEEMAEECLHGYVDSLLATAPLALALTKDVLDANLAAPSIEAAMALEDRNQVLLSQTSDFREGVHAFAEKRAARFTGR